jgi:hypothetical protein
MPPAGDRLRWSVPALLAGLTLFFYWKILFTNQTMFPWDVVEYFYPFLSFVHEELRHFRLPLWDRYVMSGFPVIGDLEAQIFYPVNWLLVLVHPFSPLPYKLVEVQLIAHFFLCGLFMYYLARSFVSDKAPALFAAILYMFSGALVAHTQHMAQIDAMAWYPLIFLLARRGLLERNYFLTISAGMLFGLQVLIGHWQHSVYLGLILLFYFAWQACTGPFRAQLWPRWMVMLLIIAGIGAALAMVQLIPTKELGNLSIRSDVTYWYVTDGNDPRYLWTLFLPNFYGGLNGVARWGPPEISMTYVFLTVPGLLLALFGLAETVRRRDFFWIGTIPLLVLLTFGNSTPLGKLLYRVPILNLFRNPARYFDPANFLLCILAGVGAQKLFCTQLSERLKKILAAGLSLLLLITLSVGMAMRLGQRIDGWRHMVAVLAVFTAIVAAMLFIKLSGRTAQWVVLALMVFELFFYNMNQPFNSYRMDPGGYVSYNSVWLHTEPLDFFRSDPVQDFRVGAVAEFPLMGNGWNVWRIPTIYGWDQIALRSYDRYIREFTKTDYPPMPGGWTGHQLNSPMLDLLGTKYLLLAAPALPQIPLNAGKFELADDEFGWWKILRNKEYLSHAWFYPQAYVLPDEERTLALMASSWFQARRALLFNRESLPRDYTGPMQELATITLTPDGVQSSSAGYASKDAYCAQPLAVFEQWGKTNDWLRYDVPGPSQPGRYAVAMKYTSNVEPTATLELEIENGGRKQHAGPVPLAATAEWACFKSRTADLGTVELGPGTNHLTIRSTKQAAQLRIYSIWLIRLPDSDPPDSGSFAFDDFSVSANRISFASRQEHDGYILLNEVNYPGWNATVDGQPAAILPADGIFRAVRVKAGSHRLEFNFWPRHFLWGAAISLLTLAAYAAYFIERRKRAARK